VIVLLSTAHPGSVAQVSILNMPLYSGLHELEVIRVRPAILLQADILKIMQ